MHGSFKDLRSHRKSRSQRPRSFWSTTGIATSGQVQHRKSAIHGLPVTLCKPRVKSDKSDWFWSQSIVFSRPFKTGMSLDLARGPNFQRMTRGTPGDEVEPPVKRMKIMMQRTANENAACRRWDGSYPYMSYPHLYIGGLPLHISILPAQLQKKSRDSLWLLAELKCLKPHPLIDGLEFRQVLYFSMF